MLRKLRLGLLLCGGHGVVVCSCPNLEHSSLCGIISHVCNVGLNTMYRAMKTRGGARSVVYTIFRTTPLCFGSARGKKLFYARCREWTRPSEHNSGNSAIHDSHQDFTPIALEYVNIPSVLHGC